MSKKKKIATLIIAILFISVGLLIADKLTNKKISNIIALFYLYFTSPREVIFDKMLIKFPFNYIKNIEKESLILLKFPNRDIIIIFKKTELLNHKDFFDNYTYRLEKLNFTSIKRVFQNVNQKMFHVLIANKNGIPEYREYVFIPSQKIIIEYFGKENRRVEFLNILQSIKFKG